MLEGEGPSKKVAAAERNCTQAVMACRMGGNIRRSVQRTATPTPVFSHDDG